MWLTVVLTTRAGARSQAAGLSLSCLRLLGTLQFASQDAQGATVFGCCDRFWKWTTVGRWIGWRPRGDRGAEMDLSFIILGKPKPVASALAGSGGGSDSGSVTAAARGRRTLCTQARGGGAKSVHQLAWLIQPSSRLIQTEKTTDLSSSREVDSRNIIRIFLETHIKS